MNFGCLRKDSLLLIERGGCGEVRKEVSINNTENRKFKKNEKPFVAFKQKHFHPRTEEDVREKTKKKKSEWRNEKSLGKQNWQHFTHETAAMYNQRQ